MYKNAAAGDRLAKNTPVMSETYGPGLVNRVEKVRICVDFATGSRWFDYPDAFESGELVVQEVVKAAAPAEEEASAEAATGESQAADATAAEGAPAAAGTPATAETLAADGAPEQPKKKKPGKSIKEFGQDKLEELRPPVGSLVRTGDKGIGEVVESKADFLVVQFRGEWKRYRFPKDVSSGLVKVMKH